MGRAFARSDPSEPVALARLSCAVGDDAEHADVFAAVLELLDLYEEHRDDAARPTAGPSRPPAASSSPRSRWRGRRTCRCPDRPAAPHPTRREAEQAPET